MMDINLNLNHPKFVMRNEDNFMLTIEKENEINKRKASWGFMYVTRITEK